MRVYDLIKKKRDGGELRYLIRNYVAGDIPDYQISAWAMAVYFQGMTPVETANLTLEMARSGDMLSLDKIEGYIVDKHSTGGVGDKTTLVLGPMVAAAGVPVAKMSGRGLGHTGGTIDKLESISGFSASLTREAFISNVNKIKIAIGGQTGNLAPADKKFYALRDVTATIDSIPLIASSVMSKKIAGGADGIVLDVKTGSGAFMRELEGAEHLARTMVQIGREVGRETIALISDMDQPLGFAVGNSLEVKEAIATLKGEGPEDLTRLCINLGAEMLTLAGRVENSLAGKELLKELLESGAALQKMKELVSAQGGDVKAVENPDLLPRTKKKEMYYSPAAGFIRRLDALKVGQAAMVLGAGRQKKGDRINRAVGLVLKKKVGDRVAKGESLMEIHYEDGNSLQEAREIIDSALDFGTASEKRPLIYKVIR
ncbi:MAG: pyrimidine-nucleoside phosphorylase [Halanaerobium sp.]|nr:pyrimidine-nucleoside phosphorylase [Halanaerobium sp.]